MTTAMKCLQLEEKGQGQDDKQNRRSLAQASYQKNKTKKLPAKIIIQLEKRNIKTSP